MGTGKDSEKREPEHTSIYQGIILPILLFIMISVFPEPSLAVTLISTILLVLILTFVFISRRKKWHRNENFRLLYALCLMDISTLMVAIFVTRILDGGISLFLLLVCLFLVTMFAGHYYRQRIIKELIQPKTVIGKLLVSFGALGGGLAALFTYWSAQFVSEVFTGAIAYGLFLLATLIFHALWPVND